MHSSNLSDFSTVKVLCYTVHNEMNLNEIYYSTLLSDYQGTLQETQGWHFMMQSWLGSSWLSDIVQQPVEPARKIQRTLDAETMILYPMLLILQVHIFVWQNTKAIKKNKFTMSWWIQIIVHCIHASFIFSTLSYLPLT